LESIKFSKTFDSSLTKYVVKNNPEIDIKEYPIYQKNMIAEKIYSYGSSPNQLRTVELDPDINPVGAYPEFFVPYMHYLDFAKFDSSIALFFTSDVWVSNPFFMLAFEPRILLIVGFEAFTKYHLIYLYKNNFQILMHRSRVHITTSLMSFYEMANSKKAYSFLHTVYDSRNNTTCYKINPFYRNLFYTGGASITLALLKPVLQPIFETFIQKFIKK